MACNCIDDVNEKLKPDHTLNTTLGFSGPSVALITLIRRDTWAPEKRRGKPGNFLATFCPFCGERYVAAEAEEA